MTKEMCTSISVFSRHCGQSIDGKKLSQYLFVKYHTYKHLNVMQNKYVNKKGSDRDPISGNDLFLKIWQLHSFVDTKLKMMKKKSHLKPIITIFPQWSTTTWLTFYNALETWSLKSTQEWRYLKYHCCQCRELFYFQQYELSSSGLFIFVHT